MSAERHKNPNIETRREVLGRWGEAAGIIGGAAIALATWSVEAGIPFFLYTELGSILLRFWGAQSRKHPKKESFFKRRKVASATGGH